MPRPRINGEAIPGRFPPGTKARLTKVRTVRETQADQLRKAVELLIRKRERERGKVAK